MSKPHNLTKSQKS